MRQPGGFGARIANLVRKAALGATAAALWAGPFADPATAPPGWPVSADRQLSLHAELTQALAERAGQFNAAASRSEPAPEPPKPDIVWPASGGLTGWWGERRGAHRHPGIDIDGNTGDPVVAAAAGAVTHAGPSPAGYSGYGTVVIIAHGDGLTSIYAHLAGIAVRAGQVVTPGQRVGTVGTTGNVTGSHLHFELRRGGAAIDPASWLPKR